MFIINMIDVGPICRLGEDVKIYMFFLLENLDIPNKVYTFALAFEKQTLRE